MELGWIVLVTLRLTKENLLRIKETLFHFIDSNPIPSAIVLVAIAAMAMGLILKHKNSA